MRRGWRNINVHVDISGVEKKLDANAVARGRGVLGDTVLQTSNTYVPADAYTLRTSGHVNHNRSDTNVMWRTPYARAQYKGTNGIVVFRNYTTPGTGKRWVEKAARNHRKEWENSVLKGMGF